MLIAEPLSLEAYINKRVDLMKENDPSLSNDERDLLWKLMTLRKKSSSALLDPELAEPVYKDFRKTWVDVPKLPPCGHLRSLEIQSW